MKKILTLCMVFNKEEILLGMKKRGFGVGRWNGFGGKIEDNETIEEGAIRELKEEAGIIPTKMKKIGILEFSFQDDPKILETHIFKIYEFTGEPSESEEMKPQWFKFENIPFLQMWSDDIYWFPYLMNETLFKGSFLFDRPSDSEYSSKIIIQELNEVENL